ncbi:unnamed protein product [Rodentolepis nana]|uniref:RGS domain-containing protein n=1 Tax=Rodentolepis nana TaxID=102285 RepID=A0A158QHJ5_RODNA|nr:unnamed protein product [Rodentolepis nana]
MEVFDEINKIERMIEAMQESDTGINFKTQKVFLTTVPAAVTGDDLISWIENYFGIDHPQEASHIALLLLLYGYVYPLTDYKSNIVKDDPTSFYRFQAPYYWISKISKPDSIDYAIYLVKRILFKRQKHSLEEHEQTALNRLQNALSHKWDFICMQAADQMRLFKDKRKSDQIVIEAQERAFWRVHRHNCSNAPLSTHTLPPNLRKPTPQTLPHSHLRLSNKKSVESLLLFTTNRSSYDWFVNNCSAGLGVATSSFTSSPWLNHPSNFEVSPCAALVCLPTCDSLLLSTPIGSCLSTCAITEPHTDILDNPSIPFPTINQVRIWATSFDNLLWDPNGCQSFKAFLEKEFSSENLRFWLSVNAYQFSPIHNLKDSGQRIYEEFLAPNAPSEINIDCATRANTVEALKNPTRFVFAEAKQQIYKLMKSDSYVRFLRSDDYSAVLRLVLTSQHVYQQHSNRRSFIRSTLLPTGAVSPSISSAQYGSSHNLKASAIVQKPRVSP